MRLRKFVDELLEDDRGLLRAVLIAAHVRNLVIIGHGFEIIDVIEIGGRNITADVTLRRADRIVVIAVLILRERLHQQRFAFPLREPVLLLERRIFLGRLVVIVRVDIDETLIVERLRRRIRDDLGFVFFAAENVHRIERTKQIERVRASRDRQREHQKAEGLHANAKAGTANGTLRNQGYRHVEQLDHGSIRNRPGARQHPLQP